MERTYRNVSYPILGWFAIVVIMTGGLLGAIRPHYATTIRRILTVAVPLAVSVILYRAYVRAKIVTHDQGVTVYNPFRTVAARWSDIEGFDMVTAILRIRLKTGDVIRAWAVQPAGLRHVATRGSRADEILNELGSMLASAKPEPET